MKKRYQLLIGLDSNTFYKLVLRMGYNSERITSEEEKREFIKVMISDEKILQLLKEQDEQEK